MTEINYTDVFNGDADDISALIEYSLSYPAKSELITGVKRNISLLDKASTKPRNKISVFDISWNNNSTALKRLLSEGASVFYVDHHLSGDIPEHPKLKAIIDTSPKTCTSLLVDQYLQGKYREWTREQVRSRLPYSDLYEVYCECELSVCEERDSKGLYARAGKREIENFKLI